MTDKGRKALEDLANTNLEGLDVPKARAYSTVAEYEQLAEYGRKALEDLANTNLEGLSKREQMQQEYQRLKALSKWEQMQQEYQRLKALAVLHDVHVYTATQRRIV